MDFTIPDEMLALRERTERFVRDEIMPCETDKRQTPHGPTEEFRLELMAAARQAGLLAPHVGREWGGLGLDHRGKAVVFEAAGYSPLASGRSHSSFWRSSATCSNRCMLASSGAKMFIAIVANGE